MQNICMSVVIANYGQNTYDHDGDKHRVGESVDAQIQELAVGGWYTKFPSWHSCKSLAIFLNPLKYLSMDGKQRDFDFQARIEKPAEKLPFV